MADRAAFVDDSGETRLSGELFYPGSTADDVLTVQADGSIAAAPGGYTPPITGEDFSGGTTATVPNNAGANLAWSRLSGATLVDLTDPTVPAVIESGVYAVSISATSAENMTDGGFFRLGLELDSDDTDVSVTTDVSATAANLQPYGSLSGTWYIPAGGTIRVHLVNHDGSEKDFGLAGSFIQRLS